ncbi:MAG TPA: PQQ-binding-like beta-propeller repeat protein, partial [Vicinamibacteria bacterium]|nr:PQQ-binding-like beta-propeller repeat protein [Vicinamibacteria bacterium]
MKTVYSLGLAPLLWIGALAYGNDSDRAPWHQWGGPERNFHVSSPGIATSWPSDGPRELWRRPLGEGYSSIVTDGNALYTMYRVGDDEIVVSLDASTGKTLWEHRYMAPLLEHMDYGTWLRQGGAGPYATPLLLGDTVYAVGTTGKFHGLHRRSGDIVWSHDLDEKFQMRGYRGYAPSPILYEETLILPIGGRGQGVVAFDPATGAVVWKNQDFGLAPASPVLIGVDGQDQLVVFGPEDVVGLNPGNGEKLWSYPHPTNYGLNISTPVWGAGNLLFTSAAYDGGSRVVRLTRANGKTTAEELWSSNRLRLHFGNAIRIGNLVLGTSGDFGPAFFIAIDVETGEEVWRERTFGRSQMIYVDSKLVIVDEGGDIAIATAGPDGLTVHARAEVLTENAWT